jgi:hypothetical protein
MDRWREQAGQASGEYVALVAVVAVVLVLAAGLTSGGVGARVLAGLQRGLCTITRHDCPRPAAARADLAACPVARSERSERLGAAVEIARLGVSGTLGAVRLSDGRVVVTLADGADGGGEVGFGLRIALAGHAAGASVRGGVSSTWASGREWTLPDAAAARAFVARYGEKATVAGKLVDELRSRCSLLCDALGWRPHAQLPPPDAVFTESGTTATLAASLGVGETSYADGRVLGVRRGRDGTSTWYVRFDASRAGGLGLPLAGLEHAAARQTVIAYTRDARGRPRTLAIEVAGKSDARGTLRGGEHVRVSGGAGRAAAVEVEATLDLGIPANAAAAAALVRALVGSDPLVALPPALAAVRERIHRAGEVDVRRYALASAATELGARVGLGLELGGSFERTSEGLRLLDAETRLPGLPLLPRDDCNGS